MQDTIFWDLDKVKAGLSTKVIGQELLLYSEIESTNTEAINLIKKGVKSGTVLLAEEQTRGRGRGDRTWHSASGKGIWMSLVLEPLKADNSEKLINMICALSVVSAVKQVTSLNPQIKWPNDVWVNNKKVCGILIEPLPKSKLLVAGLGINISQLAEDFPPELQAIATSLEAECDGPVDREEILVSFLKSFEEYYSHFDPTLLQTIITEYRAHSLLLNKKATINNKTRGTVVDFDTSGGMVLETESGDLVTVTDGEVIIT